jgi:hypothetical protein
MENMWKGRKQTDAVFAARNGSGDSIQNVSISASAWVPPGTWPKHVEWVQTILQILIVLKSSQYLGSHVRVRSHSRLAQCIEWMHCAGRTGRLWRRWFHSNTHRTRTTPSRCVPFRGQRSCWWSQLRGWCSARGSEWCLVRLGATWCLIGCCCWTVERGSQTGRTRFDGSNSSRTRRCNQL